MPTTTAKLMEMSEKIKESGSTPGVQAVAGKKRPGGVSMARKEIERMNNRINPPDAARRVREEYENSAANLALGGLNALKTVRAEADQIQQRLFGERIGAVSESDMQQFDDQIPEFAQRALRTARKQALEAGATVLEAINGELVETSPDGSRRFIKSLPAPYKVALGSKRIRRAN